MSSLINISKRMNTTKKEVGYLPIYEKYLRQFKNKKINLLEIGFTKDSLKLFKTYFPKANIIGLDIELRKKDQFKKPIYFMATKMTMNF